MKPVDVLRSVTCVALALSVLPLTAGAQTVRILQTNFAGDRQHIIDPVTDRVVGEIVGTELCHGIAATSDGSKIFCSNELDKALDVSDGRTYKLIKRIPLSGTPNNIALARDERKLYVGIRQGPATVDVIDTNTLTKVNSIPTKGNIHNLYVTPDGKFVYAGSPVTGTIDVLDLQTEKPAWDLKFTNIRPMSADAYPDGSTRNLYVQDGDMLGFIVVDFKTRKEVRRIMFPELEPGRNPIPYGPDRSHGIYVTADNKVLVACSGTNNALYSYSLPDLKLLGTARLTGTGPGWVTVTPDGKKAYLADLASNQVLVVDVPTMKEVAKIKVGNVPKRSFTWVITGTATK